MHNLQSSWLAACSIYSPLNPPHLLYSLAVKASVIETVHHRGCQQTSITSWFNTNIQISSSFHIWSLLVISMVAQVPGQPACLEQVSRSSFTIRPGTHQCPLVKYKCQSSFQMWTWTHFWGSRYLVHTLPYKKGDILY